MTGRSKKKTNTATVGRPDDYHIEATEFGHLIWRVAGFLGNSTTMTVGECVIEPGKANGRHYHPNCDEILFVVKGHIHHTAGEEVVEMNAGDIISIPTSVVHNAANIGDKTAHLQIAFSSADRQTLGAE